VSENRSQLCCTLCLSLSFLCLWANTGVTGAQSIDAAWHEKLSKPAYTQISFHMYQVKMSDGIMLSAAVWKPATTGEKFPVIMISTPYNKLGAGNIRDGEYFAHRGYAFVAYDKRGRYDSDGEADRYGIVSTDGTQGIGGKDGLDFSEMQTWAGTQSWSTGKIGTLGNSASGGVQWFGALHQNKYLAAMIPTVAPDDHHYNSFPDGAYQLSTNVNALLGAAGMKTNTPAADIDFDKWYRFLPLKDLPDYVGIKNSHIWRWEVAHPDWTPDWPGVGEHLAPGVIGPGKYSQIKVPTYNLTGWYDQCEQQVISSFEQIVKYGTQDLRSMHKLMIGPWTHGGGFQVKQGDLTFPAQAAPDGEEWKLRWFDRYLKGMKNGIDEDPPVYIYVMGADKWRNECEWPLKRTQYVKYYLDNKSAANSLAGDGFLQTASLPKGPADTFTYDPHNPVLTYGGNVAMSPPRVGPRDQHEIELRPDVLVYTTAPLETDTEVTGHVVLHLFASTDRTDTDFTGKLVDVHPDGYAQILVEGVIRGRYWKSYKEQNLLTPGSIYEFYIDLWSTSQVFKKGHQIRLEVSSSNFPKYDRNPNTGHKFGEDAELVVAHQKIYHDADHPSYLLLPIIPANSKPCEDTGTTAKK
jgi:putative CocE/NonD family hydrolase